MPDRRKKNGYGIVIYRGLNEMVWYGQVHIRETQKGKLYNRTMVTVIMQEQLQTGGHGMNAIGIKGNGNKLGLGMKSYGKIGKSE